MHFTDDCEERVELALLETLAAMEDIRARGLTVRMGNPCGVVIASGPHIRAIWHAGKGQFDLIPAGYNTPQVIVSSIDEVKRLTRDYLAKKSQQQKAFAELVACSCASH